MVKRVGHKKNCGPLAQLKCRFELPRLFLTVGGIIRLPGFLNAGTSL